jgi:hypothetical protein
MKPVSPRVRLGAVLLGVGLLVSASLTATTRAGSVRTLAKITVSPHVLTVATESAPNQGFLTATFINTGPSTVNHVVMTIRDKNGGALALSKSAFDAFPLPAGCVVTGTTTSLVTCDLGQVPPGTVRRGIRFSASEVTTFTPFVSASFDESKNTGLTDTVTDVDFPLAIVTSATQDRKGECTATESDRTLTALGSSQQTSLTYHPLSALLVPCTPASSGVDQLGPGNLPNPTFVPKPFNAISFVDFLAGSELSTVKVFFLTTPKGITKKNLALFEMANYPDTTLTANGAAVPKCVTVDGVLQIPANSPFHSCVVGVDTLGGGGLVATLLAQGGSDPGWGGIG